MLAACAHAPPPAPSLPAVSIAPQTVVNDPVLEDRGTELRAALAKALADEGFRVIEKGGLVATTSIDYAPWTSISPASLYVVVTLKNEGISVDQVEVQKINEAFPENPADLARTLAHALATSPRLREFLAAPK
jgi:hypothetical protein